MGCGVAGACDVTQDGGQDGSHIAFYSKLEIIARRWKLKFLDAIHAKYVTIKKLCCFLLTFLAFFIFIVIIVPKFKTMFFSQRHYV